MSAVLPPMRRPEGRLQSPAVRLRVSLGKATFRHASPWVVLRIGVVSAVCVLAVVTAATSAAARSTQQRVISTLGTMPLRTAIFDPIFAGPQGPPALPMARAAGATYVRIFVWWNAIAPGVPPQGFVAADPTSPGYRWANLDTLLGDAEAAG